MAGETTGHNMNAVLNDEQHITVRCVEDILLATDGARFYTLTGMDALRYTPDPAYAVFVVEPNPAHILRVANELAPSALRVRVNGVGFTLKRPKSASPEGWIERQGNHPGVDRIGVGRVDVG